MPLRSSGGGAGGQAAKDALGNDVKESAWLATHKAGARELTQGLKVRGKTILRLVCTRSASRRTTMLQFPAWLHGQRQSMAYCSPSLAQLPNLLPPSF